MSRRLAQDTPELPPQTTAPRVTAVVALGANLGDRAATLAAALDDLGRLPLTRVRAAADPIETVALTLEGLDAEAPSYLNSVALLETRLAPSVLLSLLHAIEQRHGRAPRAVGQPRWQDRTLDLDLIAYAEVLSDDPDLALPHPRAAERDFVLAPWLAIDPDAVLPGHGRVDALLAHLRAAEETS